MRKTFCKQLIILNFYQYPIIYTSIIDPQQAYYHMNTMNTYRLFQNMILIQQFNYYLNMAFVTILRKINAQSHRYQRNTTQKIYSKGNYFVIKHFIVDWQQFFKSQHVKVQTPLLRICFGTFPVPYAQYVSQTEMRVRNSKKIRFVTMNSNQAKRAHSCVLTYKNRENIFKILNQASLTLKNFNLISIYFQYPSVVASPEHILDHLKQSVNKIMGKTNNYEQSKTYGQNFFGMLYPFNLSKWSYLPFQAQWKKAIQIQKKFLKPLSFNIYLCHHYKIISSKNIREIYEDMQDFHLILKKFNFLKVIAKMQNKNHKKIISRCKEFIKVLKWRTIETEKYLVFLILEYGQERIIQSIFLFKQAYNHYLQHKKLKNQPIK